MDRKATSNEPTHRRYVLYPIQEEALWDMYKTAESKFWTAEDFAFPTTDNAHDKRMDDLAVVISPLMTILSNMLMYRGSNTLSILASKTAHQEAKAFLSYQGMMRNIHAECYGNIIAYIAPNSLHGDVVSTIENRDAYAPCKTWVDSHKEARISVYAAVAACEETILFSSFQLIVGLAQALKIPNIAEIASKIRTDAELTTAFLIRLCARDADHSHLAEIRTTIQRALEFELSAIEGEHQPGLAYLKTQMRMIALADKPKSLRKTSSSVSRKLSN
ncbi:ferritin-like superfamily [Mycena polygramma]|nr:ferritin-like superfamily [Mycena polygramma]